MNIEELTDIVKDTLSQNKGNDIVIFDVGERTSIAKYMIIASSESSRHVKALAEYVIKSLKQYGKTNVEGMQEGNWVIVGFHDIMIHIFRSDVREYYQIDELWSNEKSLNEYTMQYKSKFLNFISSRGYFYQCTDLEGLDELMSNSNITVYIGFDCTAPSLHIGSLVQIMMLRHLQKFNHKPIILLGSGTTKIGDPTGKDKARVILNEDEIKKNTAGIKTTLEKFISSTDVTVVDNSNWLSDLKYIDFLRDIGRHFSINRMLNFESVKTRLEREQSLSFLEFNYMLLQAYDFIELNKKYDCRLQIGGSDQWGNIVNGVELGSKLNLPELFGLTTPLILTTTGKKMGKTAEGKTIWLDPQMCSPYDYWQYFRNVEDSDLSRFLRLFTELPLSEIKELESLKDQEINEAKKILATEATKICHGEDAAKNAENAAVANFENKDSSLLPQFSIEKQKIENDGVLVVELLSITGFAESNGAAKRLINGGGCRVNDIIIDDQNHLIKLSDFDVNGFIKLSAGKKRHIKVKLL